MIKSERCCERCIQIDTGFFCCANYFKVENHDFYIVAKGQGEVRFMRKDGLGYVDYTFDTLGNVVIKEVVCQDKKLTIEQCGVVNENLFLRLGPKCYVQWFEALERFCWLVEFFCGVRIMKNKRYLDDVALDGFEDISEFDRLCEDLKKLEIKVTKIKAIYGVRNIYELFKKYGEGAWVRERD